MACGKHIHRTREKANSHLLQTKVRSHSSAVYFCSTCDGYHVGRANPWQDRSYKKRETVRLMQSEDENEFPMMDGMND